jgi:hypothetical protein
MPEFDLGGRRIPGSRLIVERRDAAQCTARRGFASYVQCKRSFGLERGLRMPARLVEVGNFEMVRTHGKPTPCPLSAEERALPRLPW